MTRSLVALSFLLLVAACSSPPAPTAITKLVVSHSNCDTCSWDQATFFPDGRFEIDGAERVVGRRSATEFASIARDLVTLPAFGHQADLANESSGTTTTFWIEAGQRAWQVKFPSGWPPQRSGPVRQLQVFDHVITAIANLDRYEARLPTIQKARQYEKLQWLKFVSRGCYGECPSFTVTFRSDGSATLDRPIFVNALHRPHSIATVRFTRVIAALKSDDAPMLERAYRMRAVDTYGVSLQLHYASDFDFNVDAPDSTTWDMRLARLVGALTQLVNDTDWQ